jgi:hypothetical protein
MSVIEAQKAFETYFALSLGQTCDRLRRIRYGLRQRSLGALGSAKSRTFALHRSVDRNRRGAKELSNVSFERAGVDDHSLPSSSQDLGYSLDVLHHLPNTEQAIRSCAELLTPGVPLLCISITPLRIVRGGSARFGGWRIWCDG